MPDLRDPHPEPPHNVMHTRATLDPLVCCENHPLELAPICHPDAGLRVIYFEGCLFFACSECQSKVASALIAGDLDG